jgi:acyl-CoA thioester hydrolase
MSDVDLTDPATYEHWVDERVRFSDTDLVGHVNNVGIAAYVESGRVAYASALMRPVHDAGLAVTLRRVEIDYLAELHYPAALQVGSRLLTLGRTSLTVGTGVFDGRRCVATSRGVLVAVGPDGPAPIDGETRRELEAALAPPHRGR